MTKHRWSIGIVGAALLCTAPQAVNAAGGPDAYGYTWQSSDDPGGPAYSWIDITALGTELTGLVDDNAVPVVVDPAFAYYWSTFDVARVGVDGVVSFDSEPHTIASCFDSVPTAGGQADAYLAPMMRDLTLQGLGNPGRVYTWSDPVGGRFVVSWVDVPSKSALPPGYAGSNTFQLILFSDGRAIFNVMSVDPAESTCSGLPVIGIENQTGNIGLEIANGATIAASTAFELIPPVVPGLQIADIAPQRFGGRGGRGLFMGTDGGLAPTVSIKNVGNAASSPSISVQLQVRSGANVVHTETVGINGLGAGAEVELTLEALPPIAAGAYSVVITTTNASDINPTNNTHTAELVVIDASGPPTFHGFAQGAADDAAEGTVGVYVRPASFPASIDRLRVQAVARAAPVPAAIQLSVYAESAGPGGTEVPGDLLAQVTAPVAGSGEVEVDLTPIPLSDEGVFVVFEENSDYAVGMTSAGPPSRQTFEYRGAWAPWRRRNSHDLLLAARVEFSPATYDGVPYDGVALDAAPASDAGECGSNEAGGCCDARTPRGGFGPIVLTALVGATLSRRRRVRRCRG